MRFVLPLLLGILFFQVVTRMAKYEGVAVAQSGSSEPGRFEDLSAENKKLVKDSYRQLLAAQEKKDFSRMSTLAESILTLVSDYNDTMAYLLIARRGLEQARLDKDMDAIAKKEQALRDLAALELRGQGLLAKARYDLDARAELYKTMKELQRLDPNNEYPLAWKKKLQAE